jgi:hypothetical protein
MSNIKNNGGTALSTFHGMTLRDYFAAKAMQGFLATDDYSVCSDITLAVDSYKIADAMLEARGE